mmetsp:Transcript_26210/g.37572  ORF Transcript_26210/g.37572 Transcript_26210/m.37572 type:complete len:89 (+) Transcript_26210:217-483(+)
MFLETSPLTLNFATFVVVVICIIPIKQVMEKKAIQMKGGVCLGAENPTWLKQSSDKMVSYFALFIAATGLTLAVRGHYHMAYGIGKKE